jgi:RNA polymerase nonessential primary-like sigma factor
MAPSIDPFAQNEALVAALQTGDPQAAETLLHLNRFLIRKAPHVYLARAGALEFDDLLREGALGLFRAVALFDPERGTRSSTYAMPWIQQYMLVGHLSRSLRFRVPDNINTRDK